MRVLNFGSLNIDYIYRVPHIAKPGETISAKSFDIFAGGKGANQSVAAARAGARVFHAGKVGKDAAWIADKMKNLGVETKYITISDSPAGHAVIQVDDAGRNSIFVFAGCNKMIEKKEIDNVLNNFDEGDYLLLQNEINEIPYLIEKGRECGMKICFNPAPFEPEVLEYPIELVDTMILNESEAAGIMGIQPVYTAVDEMIGKYPRMEILITRGKYGVIYASASERTEVPAYAAKVVDTTAAGDTFIGYYLAFKSPNRTVRDTLKIAARAAAICVTRKGAMDSIPMRSEVENAEMRF